MRARGTWLFGDDVVDSLFGGEGGGAGMRGSSASLASTATPPPEMASSTRPTGTARASAVAPAETPVLADANDRVFGCERVTRLRRTTR